MTMHGRMLRNQSKHIWKILNTDYYLFRSIQHGLSEQHLNSYEEVKNWIDGWLASKDERWYYKGIHQLPERWKKVIVNDGLYFDY